MSFRDHPDAPSGVTFTVSAGGLDLTGVGYSFSNSATFSRISLKTIAGADETCLSVEQLKQRLDDAGNPGFLILEELGGTACCEPCRNYVIVGLSNVVTFGGLTYDNPLVSVFWSSSSELRRANGRPPFSIYGQGSPVGVDVTVVHPGFAGSKDAVRTGARNGEQIVRAGGSSYYFTGNAELSWESPYNEVFKVYFESGENPVIPSGLTFVTNGKETPGPELFYNYVRTSPHVGAITIFGVEDEFAGLVYFGFKNGPLKPVPGGIRFDLEERIRPVKGKVKLFISSPEDGPELPLSGVGVVKLVKIFRGHPDGVVVTDELRGFRIGFIDRYGMQRINPIRKVASNLLEFAYEQGVGAVALNVTADVGIDGGGSAGIFPAGLGVLGGYINNSSQGIRIFGCGPLQSATANLAAPPPIGLGEPIAGGSVSIAWL